MAVASWRVDDDVTIVLLWHMWHTLPGSCWAWIKAPVMGRQQNVSLQGEWLLWIGSSFSFLLTHSAEDPSEPFPVHRQSCESNILAPSYWTSGWWEIHFSYWSNIVYNILLWKWDTICQRGKIESTTWQYAIPSRMLWSAKEKRSRVLWQCDVEILECSDVSWIHRIIMLPGKQFVIFPVGWEWKYHVTIDIF